MAMPLLVLPMLLASCSNTTPLGGSIKSSKIDDNDEKKPATNEDLFLYRTIGSSFFCNARSAGVEFPKAIGIAAGTYAQVLNGRHGGFVASSGKKKLTNKTLIQ